MLAMAVKAQLPLIAVRTTDTVNLADVIEHLTGRTPKMLEGAKYDIKEKELYLYIHPMSDKNAVLFGALYPILMKRESTLIVVNQPRIENEFFDAGEVPVPKDKLVELLEAVADNKEKAIELASAVGGTTLKETAELAQLTMARDHGINSVGLIRSRKEFFQQQQGLTLVDNVQSLYIPNKELEKWAAFEKTFFLSESDPRLIPRGILLDGIPGTGKTAGAKYMSALWGVPLYHVDISAAKTKWVGESESNFSAILTRLDNEEPAIALFDEIEKIFGAGDYSDSGVTTGIMSQFLWWLAEHKSRVLTYMTTNKADKLPPELFRAGRVDKKIVLDGLTLPDSVPFIKQLMATFGKIIDDGEALNIAKIVKVGNQLITPATLVEEVKRRVKTYKTDG